MDDATRFVKEAVSKGRGENVDEIWTLLFQYLSTQSVFASYNQELIRLRARFQ